MQRLNDRGTLYLDSVAFQILVSKFSDFEAFKQVLNAYGRVELEKLPLPQFSDAFNEVEQITWSTKHRIRSTDKVEGTNATALIAFTRYAEND